MAVVELVVSLAVAVALAPLAMLAAGVNADATRRGDRRHCRPLGGACLAVPCLVVPCLVVPCLVVPCLVVMAVAVAVVGLAQAFALQVTVFPVLIGRTGITPMLAEVADVDLELLGCRAVDGRSVGVARVARVAR